MILQLLEGQRCSASRLPADGILHLSPSCCQTHCAVWLVRRQEKQSVSRICLLKYALQIDKSITHKLCLSCSGAEVVRASSMPISFGSEGHCFKGKLYKCSPLPNTKLRRLANILRQAEGFFNVLFSNKLTKLSPSFLARPQLGQILLFLRLPSTLFFVSRDTVLHCCVLSNNLLAS